MLGFCGFPELRLFGMLFVGTFGLLGFVFLNGQFFALFRVHVCGCVGVGGIDVGTYEINHCNFARVGNHQIKLVEIAMHQTVVTQPHNNLHQRMVPLKCHKTINIERTSV